VVSSIRDSDLICISSSVRKPLEPWFTAESPTTRALRQFWRYKRSFITTYPILNINIRRRIHDANSTEVRDRQEAAIAALENVQTLLDIAQSEFTDAEDLTAFWKCESQERDAEMAAEMAQKPPIERHPPLSGQQ
jgi:hypothetical protein